MIIETFYGFLSWFKAISVACIKSLFLRASFVTRKELASRLSADTVFILGCGKSINMLSADQWKHVSHNSSIGINGFCLHSFTPDVFISYFSCNDAKAFNYSFAEAIVSRYAGLKREPLILLKNINSLPLYLCDNLVFSKLCHLKLILDLPKPFTNESKFIFKLGRMLGFIDNHPFFLSFRSSVVTAISIAASTRPKKIVLLGVDLFDSCYFFIDNPTFPASLFDSSPSQSYLVASANREKLSQSICIHNTANPAYGETLASILLDLFPLIENMYGTQIFVYPSNRELPFLPVYSSFQ